MQSNYAASRIQKESHQSKCLSHFSALSAQLPYSSSLQIGSDETVNTVYTPFTMPISWGKEKKYRSDRNFFREALSMYRILIVEDNTTFRQSLKEILLGEFPSMVVEEAADGKEALRKVDAFRPDIIFMDIKLPGENGLELTKRIKADDHRIIVIILTSYDLPEYRQAADQYGADYFLSKSSSSGKEIASLVESILSDQGIDSDSPKSRDRS